MFVSCFNSKHLLIGDSNDLDKILGSELDHNIPIFDPVFILPTGISDSTAA